MVVNYYVMIEAMTGYCVVCPRAHGFRDARFELRMINENNPRVIETRCTLVHPVKG